MSRVISMASWASRHSVYREAAAPSLPGEPKFPCPWTKGYRSTQAWVRRTNVS